MDFRIVERLPTRFERFLSMGLLTLHETRFVIERAGWRGGWHKFIIEHQWCQKFTKEYIGSWSHNADTFDSLRDAEKALAFYCKIKSNGACKPEPKVIAEFHYSGPTTLDNFLEKVMK